MSLVGAWIIALCFVALVSASIAGYGLVAAIYSRHARTSLVLGLGLYTSIIVVTGLWGGYGVQVQSLLALVGIAAGWTYRRQWRRLLSLNAGIPKSQGLDRLWLILPAVYLLTRFFSCGLPQQHSDPLYYHLAAPRLWTQLGRIQLTPEHPSFAFAGLWETLYGLPQIWLGANGTDSHVITQLYAQWMHFFWGQIGCLLLAATILRRLAPPLKTRPGLAVFLGWLCVTQPAFEWLGCLAKNDYIVALFALAAVLEALDHRWLITGILMGLAFSTKVLAAWTAIAILAFIPWRKWPVYAAGAAAASAAILFRNLYWTHNPLFPMLDNVLGPHWVSLGWLDHNASYGGGPRLDPAMIPWLGRRLLEGALPKIIVVLGSLALAVEVARGRETRAVCRRRWIVFTAIQVVLAFFLLRPLADGRYANLAALSAVLFAMGCLVREAARYKPLWTYGWLAVLPLGLLINSPVDQLVKIPRDYWFAPATSYVDRFHPVFDMQRWVQSNVAPADRILFLAEKQQFYLDRPFESVVEMKSWEDLLSTLHSPDELFAALKKMGYRYVHFSPQTGGYPVTIRPYWPQIEKLGDKAVFRSSTSLVFDLNGFKSG